MTKNNDNDYDDDIFFPHDKKILHDNDNDKKKMRITLKYLS